jgi:23S rRNA pseudouridine2605 synthase
VTINNTPPRGSAPQSKEKTASSLLRINKAIAQAGICSRRRADEFIAKGKVRVNNLPVSSPGMKVDPLHDVIEVDGKKIAPGGTEQPHLYLLLNKPVRTVTTLSDPQGRKTVLDLFPEAIKKRRIFPIGRLDYCSEGLLLMTTDGDLTQKMTHPSFNHPKEYEVHVSGTVTADTVKTMSSGMVLAEGDRLRSVNVNIISRRGKTTILRMILRQGVNRQIRRMCRDLGLKVLKLKRIRQSTITLGTLAPGTFRELTSQEITALKKSIH